MFHAIVQCVLFFVTVYCYRLWQNRRTWKLLGRLPGPPNFPLIGSMYLIPGRDTSRYLKTLIDLTATCGPAYCFWLGPIPVVIVSSADHARTILNSPAAVDKAYFYRFAQLHGIFSLPAHKWRVHRKLIQPTFNQSILRSFIPVFEKKAETLVLRLSELAEKDQPFDIYRFTAKCTLDMIFATTLGTDMHIQEASTCRYLDILEELFEIVTIRIANVFLHPQWLFCCTSLYRKEVKALKEFCRPAKTILHEKRTTGMLSECSDKPFSLVDQLQSTTLDSEAIEKEIIAIIFAGNETSALTVANTILLLAMHPEVQGKLFNELRINCGLEVENINNETLNRLTYMEMVLKESLRFLPIVPLVARKISEEIDLGEYRLPANINVVIDIFDIHRNPDYWGYDADRFRPERFEGLQYDRYAFLPFSGGSRNCIGYRYAWLSMKIMLLKVLTRYRIETDLKLEDLGTKIALTLKIANGHMVRLKKRQ
ncbi:cytochrome P450 4C1-like isoform X2 [Anopheles funestus]|uniref:cytochrome P450 4C1-like isoform X2 n=1 Tax=Anopheles funestus TaxID=62324 RepID=UPI0020C6D106|nr:cytochrome P450 4C1-like isoform X2 [Anopheles funestus]